EDNHGPAAAHHALAALRRLMSWHATRDDDFLSPVVRGMGRIKPKENARSRILNDDELRAVWKAAEHQHPFCTLIRFLLFTAARRAEAAGMRWGEIEGTDWVLPAARNKTLCELVRPLSKATQALLASVPRFHDCDFVFTHGRRDFSNFSTAKAAFDEGCGVTGWTLHDLRRTARSLMSRAGVNADIAERCLGHVIPGGRGVYDRDAYHAEMLHAYEALAAQIARIVG